MISHWSLVTLPVEISKKFLQYCPNIECHKNMLPSNHTYLNFFNDSWLRNSFMDYVCQNKGNVFVK